MAQKRLPDDFRDFLHLLNRHKVKYLLLGGWAVGIHGAPRPPNPVNSIETPFVLVQAHFLHRLFSHHLKVFMTPLFLYILEKLLIAGNGGLNEKETACGKTCTA